MAKFHVIENITFLKFASLSVSKILVKIAACDGSQHAQNSHTIDYTVCLFKKQKEEIYCGRMGKMAARPFRPRTAGMRLDDSLAVRFGINHILPGSKACFLRRVWH